ncbi:neuronal calcium sensor 1-like isoform X2 [Actinia tenebrosa]|uniref:Neuronal calcium sensor 1-like isoform X2 n=1 Tax=Actinia tenebrosa TaxID=6105 RepID=A0A6P8I6W5_ACTTE|nr:neuronal calcium sensor 1-like isoform X2 [Actinia tenebrosa]
MGAGGTKIMFQASKHTQGTTEETHSMLAETGQDASYKQTDNQNEPEYKTQHIGCRIDGLEDLLQHTKFTRAELQRMYRGFKNECTNGLVDRETFKRIYAQFFPYGDSSQYANILFNVFDQNKNGKISFEDFVLGLSISLHGTLDEKMKWAFNLYDLDGDGVITREELATVVHSVHCMMGEALQPTEECSVQEQVERLFTLMDTNEDGVITEDEFIEGCKKDDSIKQSLAVFSSDR